MKTLPLFILVFSLACAATSFATERPQQPAAAAIAVAHATFDSRARHQAPRIAKKRQLPASRP